MRQLNNKQVVRNGPRALVCSRRVAEWERGKEALTDGTENEQCEDADDPPIIVPQYSRSPRADDVADNKLDDTQRERDTHT
jgi:hypothetical protein